MSRVVDVSRNAKKYTIMDMKKDRKDAMKMIYTSTVINRETGVVDHVLDNSLYAYFTNDEQTMICDSMGGMTKFNYNLKNKTKTKFPAENLGLATYMSGVSRDHKYIFGKIPNYENGESYSQKIQVWDALTGAMVFEQTVKGVVAMGFETSNDSRFVAFFSSFGNTVYVADMHTNEIIHELKGHTAYVTRTAFSDDNKRLITSSLDGTRKVWDLEKGEELVSLISTGANDYAIVTPDQYYYATKGAQKSIHFVKEMEIFPFMQFDLKYNRPDIILKKMASVNETLIRSYHQACLRRIF